MKEMPEKIMGDVKESKDFNIPCRTILWSQHTQSSSQLEARKDANNENIQSTLLAQLEIIEGYT